MDETLVSSWRRLGAVTATNHSSRMGGCSLVGVLFLAGCLLLIPLAQPSCLGQQLQFGTDAVEDSPEALKPKKPRSQQEDDRLIAATHYSYGRMLLQHEDPAGGLKHLQRAYRWDPSATTIARDIIPLASTLGRHGEAVRYAILAAERDPTDAKLLQPLGEILVEKREYERALKLFEKALVLTEKQDAPAPVLLRAEMGRLYLLAANFVRAAELFSAVRDALANPGQHGITGEAEKKLLAQRARLYPLIGESLLHVKRFDEALEMFRKANEAQADEAVLAYRMAQVAAERGDWKTASRHLDEYFAAKSVVAGDEAYALLARVIDAKLPDMQQAKAQLMARLAQLRELDPQNLPLGYGLAAKLVDGGKLEEAAKIYEELLSRERLSQEQRTTAFRALARIYHEKKNAPALVKLLGKAIDQAGTREMFESEGKSIGMDGPFFQQIVDLVRAPANKSVGHDYSNYVGVALLAISAEKPELVEELYQRALEQPDSPQNRIHEALGIPLLVADQYPLAVKVFNRAISASPPKDRLAAYYFYLSTAHALSGDHAAALEAAEKCAKLDTSSAQFQARPAWVLYHAKRLDEAQQRYRDLLSTFDAKYDSEEIRDQMRQSRLILSNIAVLQKRTPDAEEWLEQVLDEFPEDAGAQNDLGYLWADEGKHLNRALAMCQSAVQSEPENGAYRDSLGWAYFRMGKSTEAIQELEKAASLTPDGVIFDHLGDACLQAQQREKAIEAWQKAEQYFSTDQDLEKLQLIKTKLEQYRK